MTARPGLVPVWSGLAWWGTPRKPVWKATHRHKKGGLYRLVTTGTLEADRSPVAIYDDAEGNTWVRALAEFQDGRFTAL